MATSLARSRQDRLIGGVCAGIARRFGLNPTFVRILYVLVSVCSAAFPGIIVYCVLWALMPSEY